MMALRLGSFAFRFTTMMHALSGHRESWIRVQKKQTKQGSSNSGTGVGMFEYGEENIVCFDRNGD